MGRICVFTAFLFLIQLGQAANKLVGGPYVVNVSPTSATVMWLFQSSELKVGTAPGTGTETEPALRSDKVTYSGLEAGKTYYRDVPGVDGEKVSFKTAPAGPAAFRFVVYGDTRSRHDMHRRVVDAILKAGPDFVIHTGDLVADGSDLGQWLIFFSIEKELLKKVAFFPVLGNHEENDPRYYEFFDVRKPYYSFDWGTSHFAALNSEGGDNVASWSAEAEQAFWTEQTRWLEDDLRKSQGADFRFVVLHHPPFTAVKGRQGKKHPVQELVPLFERYRVAAVFCGHDHNYQHHLKNGVHYVVTGGGGAPLYEVDGPIPGLTKKVARTEHYVEIEVDSKQARIEARALDGRVIDTITLR